MLIPLLLFLLLRVGTEAKCPLPYSMGKGFNREFPTDEEGEIPTRLSRWLQYDQNLNVLLFVPAKVLFTTTHTILNNCHQKPGLANCLLSNDKVERRRRLLDSTRIMTIRDPFDRALSTYFNSDTNKYIRIGKCTSDKCSFLKWMRILKTKGIYINQHFWSQVKDSYFSQMHYDYVIRFGVKSDMDCLFQLLNTTNTHTNPSINSELSLTEKIKMFTPEIVSIVVELYALDLSVWRMAKMFSHDPLEPTLSDFLMGGNASEDYTCIGEKKRSIDF
jgi:hypothetical protein